MNRNKGLDAQSAHEDARASTGCTGLDNILDGGLPKGRIYLIEGDPGAGKTTLAVQFLLEGVRKGERALYITLSESCADLQHAARSHGVSLEDVEVVELLPDEEDLLPEPQYTVFHYQTPQRKSRAYDSRTSPRAGKNPNRRSVT